MNRIPLLTELIQDDPKDPFLPYALALEYLKQQDVQAAIDTFEALQKAHPAYLPTYYQLGVLLTETGELKRATTLLETGKALAEEQAERKTAGEIQELLWGIEDLTD